GPMVFCPSCGKKLVTPMKFCMYCGYQFPQPLLEHMEQELGVHFEHTPAPL
ncbi:MAG: zinc-ribbon domain-containing protein, partial [Thermoplasmata archaeon]|nr:zinc ribbon domain-containing protein [Thermoplasmata archaeon]NIS11012.1 zinc ribbon domain-containing protein [Thermoplasmata archaeon]NIS18944.1 zinc ribbon domain-containing protein [Thermoplasmata archaeon]NIT75993.1 zinc ribbon domain-containing protein [Thermoplasmata archaeon]NIU48093.1 zinc ribbon domain-containing protein [Thermoplasmata archaeon]